MQSPVRFIWSPCPSGDPQHNHHDFVYNLSLPPSRATSACAPSNKLFGPFLSTVISVLGTFVSLPTLIQPQCRSLQPLGRFWILSRPSARCEDAPRRLPLVIMYSKVAVVAALLAAVEARFGQEALIQGKISALGNFGQPGQAATLGGATPGVLLAATNACDKVSRSKFRPAAARTNPTVAPTRRQDRRDSRQGPSGYCGCRPTCRRREEL